MSDEPDNERAPASSLLVPQSTSLASIKAVLLAAIESSDSSTEAIANATGFQKRRVGYAKTAARALLLFDDHLKPTSRAYQLINAHPDSAEEAGVWRQVIAESPHLREYASDLLDAKIDKQTLASRIQELTGYTNKTATERAGTLLAWRKAIAKMSARDGARQLSLSYVATQPGDQEMDDEIPKAIPQLKLPKRYEILATEAKASGVDVASIVERVDSAATRVETLMRRVRDGGTGQFEIFFGQTGSGKTTFLRTLPKFFEGARVNLIQRSIPYAGIPEHIRKIEEVASPSAGMGVYVIDERDNDKITSAEAEDLFENLRLLFRRPEGRVLVIWPVTREATANVLASSAWECGAESIVSIDTRGVYTFTGVPKKRYYEIADLTVQGLAGEPLDSFGIAADEARRFLPQAETIGQFFTLVEEEASRKRAGTWQVLKEKILPKVWIVPVGDDERKLEETTALLSQGLNAQIDLQRVLNMLDDPKREANYLKEWRRRRSEAAYLMRTLDVRIIPLPPNAALAAIRAFGSDKLKEPLQKKKERDETCVQILRRTRLYKAISKEFGAEPEPYSRGKPVSEKTSQEYNRVQHSASVDDKPLNYALGDALIATLHRDGLEARVVTEKRKMIEGVTLQPDIQIWIGDVEVICLEPTWRTSGKHLGDELDKRQSSMSMGSIQRYTLQKIHEYVKALGL